MEKRRKDRKMINVYGKDGCSYCVKAQELLNQRNLSYTYIKLGIDISLEEFKEKFPNQKTVPVITVHDFKIGGYDQLVSYIEETAGGYGD
jgi:glutaredoxin 3